MKFENETSTLNSISLSLIVITRKISVSVNVLDQESLRFLNLLIYKEVEKRKNN